MKELMNNINCIIDFIKNSTNTKLLINQVNRSIGFYVNLVESEAKVQIYKIKLWRRFRH